MNKESRLLRIGVLGCGQVAQIAHFDAIRKARNAELYAICDLADDLRAKMAAIHEPRKVYARFEEMLTDPQVETKARRILRGLGYKDADFNRFAREMSGGWIMRARLARLLVMEPDLLLLDEPTNHLDLLSLLWLQKYLKNYCNSTK